MFGFFGNYGVPGVPMVPASMPGEIAPVPLEQPKQLFRFGEQSIWSTQIHQQNTALANGTFRLFSTPIGQQGQGAATQLSIGETNLKEGGRVPNGVAYDVFGISCHLMLQANASDAGTFNSAFDTAADTAQLLNVIQNGVLTWDFVQTQIDISQVYLVGSGGGVFGGIATADTGTPNTAGSLGNGPGSVWMYRKNPVALPGSATFAILLRYGNRAAAVTAGTTLGVKVTLLGYYKQVIEIG